MSSLYKFLLPLKSVILLKKCWNHFAQCEVTSYHYKIMKYPTQAQTHTSFLHFTETSQSFHNKYIFNTKKHLSKLKSRDEIICRFARLHLRRMELANIPSDGFRNPGNFLQENAFKPTFHAII